MDLPDRRENVENLVMLADRDQLVPWVPKERQDHVVRLALEEQQEKQGVLVLPALLEDQETVDSEDLLDPLARLVKMVDLENLEPEEKPVKLVSWRLKCSFTSF